ncbi:MAG TPA: nucleoside-diphosphate sugar epimerase [Ureibacillus sp.]|nr:nucleoside-diphosphate sugar epimerase [Ureibacillus sp.]
MLKLSWLISLGISLIGFLIIESFFTIQPEGSSGSGNLGAVGIALVLPFLLLSLYTTYRYFSTLLGQSTDTLNRVLILVSSIVLFGVFLYFSNEYRTDVIDSLGGPTTDPNSKIYQYPLLNQFTNSIFFNFYTFGLIHTISGVIGGLVGWIRPKKEESPK